MKKILTGAWLAGTLALPSMAQARPVVLTTQRQNYNGSGAYLAFYIVGADRKLTHRGCGQNLGLFGSSPCIHTKSAFGQ